MAAWARKVVNDPNVTTPADIQALRYSGLDDGQIFAITAFVAPSPGVLHDQRLPQRSARRATRPVSAPGHERLVVQRSAGAWPAVAAGCKGVAEHAHRCL